MKWTYNTGIFKFCKEYKNSFIHNRHTWWLPYTSYTSPHECETKDIEPNPTNTVMYNVTIFQSMTDHIYNGSLMRLKGVKKFLLPHDITGVLIVYRNTLFTGLWRYWYKVLCCQSFKSIGTYKYMYSILDKDNNYVTALYIYYITFFSVLNIESRGFKY